jgi:hypothetical protein
MAVAVQCGCPYSDCDQCRGREEGALKTALEVVHAGKERMRAASLRTSPLVPAEHAQGA